MQTFVPVKQSLHEQAANTFALMERVHKHVREVGHEVAVRNGICKSDEFAVEPGSSKRVRFAKRWQKQVWLLTGRPAICLVEQDDLVGLY